MKIIKKLAAMIISAAILFSSIPAAQAAELEESELAADKLYTLGIVQGSENGYELERKPTLSEAVVLAVRLAGGEDELGSDYDILFGDAPGWARSYYGYAREKGIISGNEGKLFGYKRAVTRNEFSAMLLRILGYSDENGDFSHTEAGTTAERLGMSTGDGSFTRADMFNMALAALNQRIKVEDKTLAEYLAENGDIEKAAANAVGLPLGRKMSGDEIYSACIDSVFFISLYLNEETYEQQLASATASGFFISSSGIAVSNYHAFSDNTIAVITLNNGEQFRIGEILSYDKAVDCIVFRVEPTSLDGKNAGAFPTMSYITSDKVKNGETVYAIGNPLALRGSITSGVVSYIQREVAGFEGTLIQNSAPISQGSSGGLLVNSYGKAIGLTCAYYSMGQNLNLAVPMDFLRSLDLNAKGCTIAEMNAAIAAQSSTEETNR